MDFHSLGFERHLMQLANNFRKRSPSSPIRAILNAPENERLELALEFINWLVPHNSSILAHYHAIFGLSYREAQLVHLLARHAPKLVPYDTLKMALNADNPELRAYSFQNILYSTRAKGIMSHTITGHGVYMKKDEAKRILPSSECQTPEPVPLEKRSFKDSRRRWSPEDDAWLKRNIDLGYPVAAQFLNRTVYAVRNRRALLEKLSELGLEPEY